MVWWYVLQYIPTYTRISYMYYGITIIRMYISLSPSLSFSPLYFYLHKKVERARVREWVENEQCRTSCVCSDLLCCLRLGSALPGCICFFFFGGLIPITNKRCRTGSKQHLLLGNWWFGFMLQVQCLGAALRCLGDDGRRNIQPSMWWCSFHCVAVKVFPSHFCGQAALPQAECEVLWVLSHFVPKKAQPLLTPIAGNMHLSVWNLRL